LAAATIRTDRYPPRRRECNRAEPRVADDLQPGRDDLQPGRKEINNCSTSSFTK
jgi:hypothetical protein